MTDNNAHPYISVNTQYIKDLSFENPMAPSVFVPNEVKPSIALTLDIKINKLQEDNVFEVELHINVEAKREENVMFRLELNYGGVFSLINFSEEQIKMILSVHCPALLFPYARKIVADTTQDGGFQALVMDPIDFGDLYYKKLLEEGQNQGSNTTIN
jgi:preprotein translocase subunit SecB